ncbi:MAG: hypothetical protein M1368_05200 [Thaumarchaeota archaeon]|nr:hypothetical protein [Nitrososphaerota archaeon]
MSRIESPPPTKILPPAGLSGNSDNSIGVLGTSNSGTGLVGKSNTGEGVSGAGGLNGVHGTTTSSTATDSGVLGEALNRGVGVTGTSRAGIGVYGKGATLAGQFDGPVTVNGVVSANDSLNVKGDINAGSNVVVTGDVTLAGSDCAEDFDASSGIEPGSVVVIENSGRLQESTAAYDKRVAGVISGAGLLKPALIMGKKQDITGHRLPLALSGKVYCKVDAEYAPIEVGDLLTTSPTRGCAMRASDPNRAFGSVIGKAMSPLDSGRGLIPILIALQ